MESLVRICLVHYHEIGLKGRNRSTFEKRLVKNIEALLRAYPTAHITRISGRVCVELAEDTSYELACEIEQIITKVPGVARVSCGYRCERDIEVMYEVAARALRDAGAHGSFKVAARRNHTDFEIHSMDMNQMIGAYLCREFPEMRVDVHNPDIKVCVEVIQGYSYIYARSESGVGGLPVGSSGVLVSLLSSGIDSPVASWMMARRGARVIGVHFSGRPQTPADSEFLVDDIAHVLAQSGCMARYYVIPFGDYQKQIAASVTPSLRVIMYRRVMFCVAEAIARKEGAKGLVTGESLGQVASQTIENITATNEVVHLPILRPLIGSDKLEIIHRAEQIGTFEISSRDASDCCTLFMPRNPETHAKLDKVHAEWNALPIDTWVEKILESAELHEVS